MNQDIDSWPVQERSAYGAGYGDAIRDNLITRIKSTLQRGLRHVELCGAELDFVLKEIEKEHQ